MDTERGNEYIQGILNRYPRLNLILEEALNEDYSVGRLQLVDACPAYVPMQCVLHKGCTITLKMPFAGIFIHWGLTFCLTMLECPPIITVVGKVYVDETALQKQLMAWDINSKNCLTKLLMGLRRLYNEYEAQEFQKNKVLAECLNELKQKQPKIMDYVEFAYIAQYSFFSVLLPLSLNTKDLPLVNDKIKLNPWILCSVRVDGSLQSHTLIMSQYLEALLENHLERVTTISNNQTKSLCDLVDAVASNIQQVLDAVRVEHIARRQFIASLLDLYPPNVADYDSKYYRHATLYFNIGDIRYVAHFLQENNEVQVTLFALDRLIKDDDGREFPFCEKLTIPLTQSKPTDPDFRQYLHETFVARLEDFMLNVLSAFATH